MKFGAVYCLYDDHEYLETSLSVAKYLDKVLFLISDIPWNGKESDNSTTIEKVKKLCKENKNFELVQGHWDNEIPQRNFGLQKFLKDRIDYCFIIDADEVYHDHHFQNIISFVKANPQIDSFHLEWNTYWKKDYYRIHPREHYQPVVCVKVKSFLFTIIRGGITSVTRTETTVFKRKGDYNAVLISPQIAICYHLSYARDDKSTRRKFETNSHAPEFVSNWYEEVWLKWHPEMKNLHPVTPNQYDIAVKEDFSVFPYQLKKFIKNEKLNDRLCTIIILNWNSCDLLKSCLCHIGTHTKRKNFQIIIVDNGSSDGSVDYIKSLNYKKILNKKNVGFAPAVNQAMKIADKSSDICLLNVDAEVQDNWLTEMYKTFIKTPEAGMVGPLGNEVASGHQCEGYVDQDTIAPNLYGYCLLIQRELVDKIGYFDEQYRVGGYEDSDYGIRAKLAGYELVISSKSLVRHKAHQVYDLNKIDHYTQDTINEKIYLNKFFGVLLDYAKVYNLFEYRDMAKRLGMVIDEDSINRN